MPLSILPCKDENHEKHRVLYTMGPYLSAESLSAMWFGKKAVDLYVNCTWKVIEIEFK